MQKIRNFNFVIAINRCMMRLVGFWPLDTQLFCDLQCGLIFIIIIIIIFPAMVQLSTTKGWESILHQASETIPVIPILARFVFMKMMRGNFQIVLRSMMVDWSIYSYSSKQDQRIMLYYARRGRRFNIFSLVLMMLSIVGYILTPILNSWLSDLPWNATTRRLPNEGSYPFRFKDSPVFDILYVAQSSSIFLVAMVIISVDCFLYIIVLHACGQFDILDAILKRYDSSLRHNYMKKMPRYRRTCACIMCIVKRHVHILNYMDIVEKSFRHFVLLQLFGHMSIIVFQGHEFIMHVRNSNFHGIITSVLYMFSFMINIFIYCYVSECIIGKSEQIGKTAHDLEWQCFPRDSNLLIIVARSRKLCKITAGKFVTMSISYYTTVLATTISYISFLAAMK